MGTSKPVVSKQTDKTTNAIKIWILKLGFLKQRKIICHFHIYYGFLVQFEKKQALMGVLRRLMLLMYFLPFWKNSQMHIFYSNCT